jgi:hypothetical protein
MFINQNWRILTIGDGDLSFSTSLLKHHQPKQLTATIFDDKTQLNEKYGDSHYQTLIQENCQVLTGFDVTNRETWGELKERSFDVVIFQFPLLPAFSSEKVFQSQCENFTINTLNRALLRNYLLNCFSHFLDEDGAKLAFITSKEVKPYLQWNIDESIIRDTNINYIGKLKFDINEFPEYKVRNVNRDKHVKSTQGTTYIYSQKSVEICKEALEKQTSAFIIYNLKKLELSWRSCHLCRTGRFGNTQDKEKHLATKKHQQMFEFEQQWCDFLQQENTQIIK